eukprot:Plantae.Rhodophyta-Hildenbrandia_rubra.ctg2343.p1 GENE.Plantae.Rhodophyta-Hildenbrandia_rubra.ctg2343~~Plantae.Rhodophyta-Hildenbrandia_rubra.ctg2343.p1  ORF type:complete len:846 (-),score=130.22 Plantae.Rhodophyta-Hildenbrandia_rubra.ctg2343:595-3132(-)
MTATSEAIGQFDDADEDLEYQFVERSRNQEVVNVLKAQLKRAPLGSCDHQDGHGEFLANGKHGSRDTSLHDDNAGSLPKYEAPAKLPRSSASQRTQALRRSRAFSHSVSTGSGTLLDTCSPDEKVDDILAVASFTTIRTMGGSDENPSELGRANAFDIESQIDDERPENGPPDRKKSSGTSKGLLSGFGKRRKSRKMAKLQSNISNDSLDTTGNLQRLGAILSPQAYGRRRSSGTFHTRSDKKSVNRLGSAVSTSSSGSILVSEDQSSETESAEVIKTTDFGFTHLKRTLRAAKKGKVPFVSVFEAMFALNERLPDVLVEKLYKFLSEKTRLKQSIRLFLSNASPRDDLTKIYQDCRVTSHDGYVIYNALCRGLPIIRHALLKNEKSCNLLFTFIEQNREQRRSETDEDTARILRLYRILRILSSLLNEDTDQLTKILRDRKGFLDILIQNHLTTPGVVDFILQLYSEDALTETQGDDPVYGAPNSGGIIYLAQRSFFKTLSTVFVSPSKSTDPQLHHKARLQREVCAELMVSMTCRALVTPVFDSTNCPYSKAQMKELNKSVDQLNLLLGPTPLAEMVDFGISTLAKDFDPDGHSLATILGVFEKLLGTIETARRSNRILTRKMVGERDTSSMESIVVANLPQLVAILSVSPRKQANRRILKLRIMGLLSHFFGSPHSSTIYALLSSKAPEAFYNIMEAYPWSSILHSKVTRSVSLSLSNDKATVLHKAWLSTVDLPGKILELQKQPRGLHGCLLQIGEDIVTFLRRTPPAKVMGLLMSEPTYRAFMEVANDDSSELALLISKKPLGGFKPEGGQSILAMRKRFTADEFAGGSVQTDGTGVYDI